MNRRTIYLGASFALPALTLAGCLLDANIRYEENLPAEEIPKEDSKELVDLQVALLATNALISREEW